jgi:hypothetical protein
MNKKRVTFLQVDFDPIEIYVDQHVYPAGYVFPNLPKVTVKLKIDHGVYADLVFRLTSAEADQVRDILYTAWEAQSPKREVEI